MLLVTFEVHLTVILKLTNSQANYLIKLHALQLQIFKALLFPFFRLFSVFYLMYAAVSSFVFLIFISKRHGRAIVSALFLVLSFSLVSKRSCVIQI